MHVAGVDGVRDAWIVSLVTTRGPVGGAVSWATCADARAVLDATGGCAAVAVDVPLALPAGAALLRRRASTLARVAV